MVGGISAGEITNVIGFIIQGGMTITDLLVAQIGTQPGILFDFGCVVIKCGIDKYFQQQNQK
ncbi:MAG: hypothetical protein O2987_03910 [Firmicutes bacterium]|nr:hypothetical protein [Bacillota bacterium]